MKLFYLKKKMYVIKRSILKVVIRGLIRIKKKLPILFYYYLRKGELIPIHYQVITTTIHIHFRFLVVNDFLHDLYI